MSQLCAGTGRSQLDDRWRVLPAGGATNIATFVSLIGPHLDITVLADAGTRGMQRVTGMVDDGLLAGNRLILASVAAASNNADIEDLFAEGDYLELFNKTFSTSLEVKGTTARGAWPMSAVWPMNLPGEYQRLLDPEKSRRRCPKQ